MEAVSGLFAPFKNHDLCLWFYLLSVAGFALLLFSFFGAIYFGLTTKNKSAMVPIFIYSIFFYFIVYFQNRLLYSMCVKSI
jgi:hypothetical protein